MVIMNILNGVKGPHREIVLINSAVALLAADKVPDIKSGIQVAKESIDTGKALNAMNSFIELSKELKGH